MASATDNASATPAKQQAVDPSLDSSPLAVPGLEGPATRPHQHSRVSSYRFSRDLAEIRKFTGSDGRDDESLFNQDETESTIDMEDLAGSGDDTEQNEKSASRDDLDAAAHSTLSKRADFILANAKKKLNLLEGNLGRARHSLLVSPQNMNELRTQSSLSSYAPVSPLDEDGNSVRIMPRFNFTPPRQARNGQPNNRRVSSGHTRMYSDTSVPSPGGQAIKGARSLEHINNRGELQSALREAPEDEEAESMAEPIEYEDEPEEQPLEQDDEPSEHEKRQSMNALRQLYGAGSPTPKSTQELRDQAEELRSRIAFLQKKSADDSAKRGPRANNPAAEQSERVFQSQVNALQKSLEDQERVIEELEAAERTAAEIENDPRGEWHQVLSRNDQREDELSDDEYFEYDDEFEDDQFPDGEVPDALEGEDTDETKSMGGAHEDREDAFDYEHFILHSGMVFPHTRQSSSGSSAGSVASADSQSTERGGAASAVDGGTEEDDTDWNQMQQPNASSASLATTQTTQSFETAHEGGESSSDLGSDTSETPNDMLHVPMQSRWPMPPAAYGTERGAGDEGEMPTPTVGGFPREVEDRGVQVQNDGSSGRPISNIVSSLLLQENASSETHALETTDVELVRSTVESFRRVCQDLGDKETPTTDSKALRERLEIARRVLIGEL